MGEVILELRAKTVEAAVEAAMSELGVQDRDQLSVEVLSEPETGFLGRVTVKGHYRISKRKNRRRRSTGNKRRSGGGSSSRNRQQGQANERPGQKSANNGARSGQKREKQSSKPGPARTERAMSDDRPTVTTEEQAAIAKDFLEGLVDAYGLEGEVITKIEDDVIVADVTGDQTEALVGVRGSVRAAIHELTRTVLQRYAQDTARLRLDIAGYGERRRQALAIYAEQLIEQLVAEGGEIVLEPMSPADRKVIHDIAATHEGVSSHSEGEPPRRFVVLGYKAPSTEEE